MANEGICLVKTCHVVITYLSPKCLKGIGKMEKKTFYPKTRIQTIMDKSPWDTNAIFIFFCHFRVALKNRALFLKFIKRCFWNFLAVLPPSTLYKVETGKKFWIYASNFVCGVRGGVGPVWIGKHHRNASLPRLLSMIVAWPISRKSVLLAVLVWST